MKNWFKGALLGLALVATPALADTPDAVPSAVSGNVVAYYGTEYFGTIDMTDLTSTGSDWFKPFQCYNQDKWGTVIVMEFVFTGVTASGTATAEFRYLKGHNSDVDLSALPVTLSALSYNPVNLYKDSRASTDFINASTIELINNTDAPTTESYMVMAQQRKSTDFTAYTPLPPFMQIGFDASTGNGWTGGTVSCRVWVLSL